MDWSLSEFSGEHTLDASSYGHTTRYGIEFDFQIGAGVNVQVGGGTEIAEGVLRQESRVVSWEEEFGLGGGIQGFRPEFDGLPGIDNCEYQYQPFLYEVVEESSFGFEHRLIVVDYLVPDGPLDRTADLDVCRQEEATTYQIFLPLVVR
jgi:hypothetical protein